MTGDSCDHCGHYQQVVGQLFDTAVTLEQKEDELHKVQPRLSQAADALTWCLAHIEPAQVPAWVRCALDEAFA